MSLSAFYLPDVPELLPSAPVYDAVRREMAHRNAYRENKIRSLLSRWVSEFEPAILMKDDEIIGLCIHDAYPDNPFVLE